MVEALPILMFATLLGLIMTGYPVAFTLAGTALLFAVIGYAFEVFHLSDLGFIPTRTFGIINNFTLVAVPLFVFMGFVLEKSGIAEELLMTMSRIFHRRRASLAISVVFVGAILAASTGIVGATVVAMGVLSLPTMLRAGYDKGLATGTIAAAGTLGQIIPPSIVLVLLGDMMNVDVGDLFVGSIFPGMLLVALYLIYIKLRSYFQPDAAPLESPNDEQIRWQDVARTFLPPIILMCIVLGSILFGLASPTEAAACGASGALAIGALRGKLNATTLMAIMRQSAQVTSMVFLILVGAQFFGIVFRGLSGDDLLASMIQEWDAHRALILIGLMLFFFVLGFFLDFLEICFIVIPIVQPIMIALQYDPLWLAVLIAVNLQTSFLTPPFGFALFYLKGVAPPAVKTTDIYRGILPFVALQLIALLIIALFPNLVLWLPTKIFP